MNNVNISISFVNPLNGKAKTLKVHLDEWLDTDDRTGIEWSLENYPDEKFWSLDLDTRLLISFEFELDEDGDRTLRPIRGLMWDGDAIVSDFEFTVKIR